MKQTLKTAYTALQDLDFYPKLGLLCLLAFISSLLAESFAKMPKQEASFLMLLGIGVLAWLTAFCLLLLLANSRFAQASRIEFERRVEKLSHSKLIALALLPWLIEPGRIALLLLCRWLLEQGVPSWISGALSAIVLSLLSAILASLSLPKKGFVIAHFLLSFILCYSFLLSSSFLCTALASFALQLALLYCARQQWWGPRGRGQGFLTKTLAKLKLRKSFKSA